MPPLTLSAAFEILELPAGADRKTARRAYLRLLKTHKPERDPEGFQRIRAAYDRIADAGDWEWAQTLQTESGTEPPAEPIHDPSSDKYGEWDERVKAAGLEEAVALAREAVADLPRYADAHWLLYRKLVEAGKRDEAAQTLREAHERGLPGFWGVLVATHGDALTELEVEELGDSVSSWQLAKIQLARERFEEASAAFARVMEAASAEFRAAPPAFSVLDFILDLAVGSPERARAAYGGWAGWLVESGTRVEGWSVPTHALTRELMSLPETFPSELFCAFAKAIRDGDPGDIRDELAAWKRKHPLSRNTATRELVNRRVPNLRAFAQLRDAPRRTTPPASRIQLLSILLAFVLLALARKCAPAHHTSLEDSREQTEQVRAQSAAARACSVFGRETPPCALARSLPDVLRFDECASAYAELRQIDEWIADKQPAERFEERGETVLSDIRRLVLSHCERSP